ncbi:penicillin-insensitive murein endopeptidase [Haliangium ochraceum]|uniref:Penicillin-insensitive murein endopeptidase n=1 Tax=Haliangium ochraceum (strain DSM 14365 / JCM 11303 / SMP-2) TaxID=502025 RepID=D0LSR2_HALO1|nr:penicillin-insensitive murein endopeptidase [Haliangium ochraceum]ACY17284.1 hypothetical protein Hoch_4794 [Haliangium ochraceum DSM 14365]
MTLRPPARARASGARSGIARTSRDLPRRPLRRLPLALICLALLLGGCPRHGLLDDGTSISYGPSNGGKLIRPALLPERGEGFVVPERWATRGLRYGTDELVSLVVYAGREMARLSPGAELAVADLSLLRGGPSAWHHSHQTGRDVDLLFFVRESDGSPRVMRNMAGFDDDGVARVPSGRWDDGRTPEDESIRELRFDAERNWLLVRTLVENPIAPVQFLFISDPLKQLLIDHARALGEPEALIQRASYLLHQPGDSLPHNDHIHVRIYCAPSDRVHGCRDRGMLRWVKKDYKYDPVTRVTSAIARNAVATAAPTPMPAMFVLGAFPFRP